MFQAYNALNRSATESPTADTTSNKSKFTKWAVVYVIALLVAGAAGKATMG